MPSSATSSNNKHRQKTSCNGDGEEDIGLGPAFDAEILDLDEEEDSDSDQVEGADGAAAREDGSEGLPNRQRLTADNCLALATNSVGRRVHVLLFSVEAVLRRDNTVRLTGERFNFAYRVGRTECKLVKTILNAHGWRECPNYSSSGSSSGSNDFNLLWTGSHVRPYNLRTMLEFQKINHFPRSYELTRKDRLFKNIQRMQQTKGLKNFDFVPPSYLVPSEFHELCQNFSREKCPFIVKPVALSRGRGIFLCNHPNQIPVDEQLIVSKYISNPYLIDGLKFDIRMYVLVTSFDPLVVYLYEEGLTRFATVKYQNTTKNLRTQCMHLTNYSVNKKSENFVQNNDADVENHGNKWSLGALLRYLKSKDIDTTCLMMKIEDIIVKSLISVEAPIANACRMFQPFRGNCFELYGYDVMIDETFRPWLLEVNLSPSLSCDSPLDFKVKSHMLCDMFGLVGFFCQDPQQKNNSTTGLNRRPKSAVWGTSPTPLSRCSTSGNSQITCNGPRRPTAGLRRRDVTSAPSVNKSEELKIVRRVKEENKRRGGWIRIFPTAESVDTYFHFFQGPTSDQTNLSVAANNQINLNRYLHMKLYPERYGCIGDWDNERATNKVGYQMNSNNKNRLSLHSVNFTTYFHKNTLSQMLPSSQSVYQRISSNYNDTQIRLPFYERKLGEEATPLDIKKPTHDSASKKTYPSEMNCPVYESDHDGYASSSAASYSDDKEAEGDDDHSDAELALANEESASNNVSHSSNTTGESIIVQKIVGLGGRLSIIQARQAFGCYLSQVHQRLLVECRTNSSDLSPDEERSRHEQLELVLRFLKRAATNLSPDDFTIPQAPDRTVAVESRQEWLAKVLGNFVRIYTRETNNAEENYKPTEDDIDKKAFLFFLRTASEANLEQTLSNYTKVNKSAGIFLNPTAAVATPLHKSASMTNITSGSSKSKASLSAVQTSSMPAPKVSTKSNFPSRALEERTISVSNLSRDAISSACERPTSATTVISTGFYRPGSTKLGSSSNNSSILSRPASHYGQRHYNEQHSNSIHHPNNHYHHHGNTRDEYDTDAINKTLQRLAVDHRNRQLTASMSSLCDGEAKNPPPLPAHSHHSNLSSPSNSHQSDSVAQFLVRQYNQSKQLLQESRAKHKALLAQNTSSVSSSNPLVNKPPPGIRTNPSLRTPFFTK